MSRLLICRECGAPFEARRSHSENLFCAVVCAKEANNRRMRRGAQLYDLFMVLRYERSIASAKGVWSIMCRLAQSWREEDVAKREGRSSWRSYDSQHDKLAPLRVEKLKGLDFNAHRSAVENGISARSLRGM